MHTIWLWLVMAAQAGAGAAGLEPRLREEDPQAIAADARKFGDAKRGAILFYRPALLCAKCHDHLEPRSAPLGPDLTRLGKTRSDAEIVTSILEPSKTIARGYETVTVITREGKAFAGLLAEDRADAVVIRDLLRGDGQPVSIPKNEIEGRRSDGPSIMPEALVASLTSRDEFLDLVRYVYEIAENGPARARELKPDPALLAVPLPEYERALDHAGLLRSLDEKSLERGAATYERVCVNCHGDRTRAGSLPTAPRFAAAELKTGGDPYRMYRTITEGLGQMPPQTWMVPSQKYDVIHYIRETFLKERGPKWYRAIDETYLASLPRGTTRGPAPSKIEPWSAMDYGPTLTATYEIGRNARNFAYKGIAIRLDAGQGGVSRGQAWAIFDEDTLRMAAGWTGQGFIDWNGINFNGKHQVHPRIVGTVQEQLESGVGWARPGSRDFGDTRLRGRDGRRYGPLERSWGRFLGQYRHGARVILAYTVGSTRVLETYGLVSGLAAGAPPVITRTLEIGPSRDQLALKVAGPESDVVLAPESAVDHFEDQDGVKLLVLPGADRVRGVKIVLARKGRTDLAAIAQAQPAPEPLEPLTHGGKALWPETISTQAALGSADGAFAIDVLPLPITNPWLAQMRVSGLDFFPDGRSAALCTWDGDVWIARGIDQPENGLSWRRIASGMFQPLGIRIVGGVIHVCCRDQIVRLHDSNGDGETDFYETFNSDHQVTDHFHEFALDLQTDAAGNFYYARAARHGLEAVVPQHGTLLKVTPDGASTEILATGFRAPNGVCLNPDGTFFVTDQEGFWLPKNAVEWVRKGTFHGNMWGYHDVKSSADSAMTPPICWITNAFDRSPAEPLWVTSKNSAWAPLAGSLLCLSYGNGKVFVVLRQQVGDLMQGGMCALPIPAFPTGVMRGRFHPTNGQLYVCGLYAWAGDRTSPGGFFRVRATGKPIDAPIGLEARQGEMEIRFTTAIDPASVAPDRFKVKTWGLIRSAKYGSDHINEKASRVTQARLTADGRGVRLAIADLKPTWCMEIAFDLRAVSGEPVQGVINNTIHRLEQEAESHAADRGR